MEGLTISSSYSLSPFFFIERKVGIFAGYSKKLTDETKFQ